MNPDFQILCTALDDELNVRYGISQLQYEKLNVIDDNHTVIVGYIGNEPIACGCIKEMSNQEVEIKRMFVVPEYRRRGFSSKILSALEVWAVELGYSQSLLETGKKQPEAIQLYKNHGYREIENYGPYTGLDNSICMKKTINNCASRLEYDS